MTRKVIVDDSNNFIVLHQLAKQYLKLVVLQGDKEEVEFFLEVDFEEAEAALNTLFNNNNND